MELQRRKPSERQYAESLDKLAFEKELQIK
jgi:hypothetical protein